MARRRSSLRRLQAEVAKRFPDIPDPAAEIAAGRIAVDGRAGSPVPGSRGTIEHLVHARRRA